MVSFGMNGTRLGPSGAKPLPCPRYRRYRGFFTTCGTETWSAERRDRNGPGLGQLAKLRRASPRYRMGRKFGPFKLWAV